MCNCVEYALAAHAMPVKEAGVRGEMGMGDCHTKMLLNIYCNIICIIGRDFSKGTLEGTRGIITGSHGVTRVIWDEFTLPVKETSIRDEMGRRGRYPPLTYSPGGEGRVISMVGNRRRCLSHRKYNVMRGQEVEVTLILAFVLLYGFHP